MRLGGGEIEAAGEAEKGVEAGGILRAMAIGVGYDDFVLVKLERSNKNRTGNNII